MIDVVAERLNAERRNERGTDERRNGETNSEHSSLAPLSLLCQSSLAPLSLLSHSSLTPHLLLSHSSPTPLCNYCRHLLFWLGLFLPVSTWRPCSAHLSPAARLLAASAGLPAFACSACVSPWPSALAHFGDGGLLVLA